MVAFYDYLRPRLEASGYKASQTKKDLFVDTPDGKTRVWICYLDAPIEPEQIRRCFQVVGFHILFVVDEKLIPQELVSRKETPMWLRVLHGLYMGRIYVWNQRHLFGLHFDYETGDVSESGIIQPDELLLTESGTWLRGWTGVYKLARFYDKTWWNAPAGEYDWESQHANAQKEYAKQQSNARADYEQARDHYWEQQRAREQQQTHEYSPFPPPPKQTDSKHDFMQQFARAGSPSAIKALYRTLAKQYHPDISGYDTSEIMKEINIAYEHYR